MYGFGVISRTVWDCAESEWTLKATARKAGMEMVGGFSRPEAPRIKLAGTRALTAVEPPPPGMPAQPVEAVALAPSSAAVVEVEAELAPDHSPGA